MFEQAFKNLDDVLRKEAGCSSELDYTEQTSWLLFLKYLDDLETEKAMKAELLNPLPSPGRWSLEALTPKSKFLSVFPTPSCSNPYRRIEWGFVCRQKSSPGDRVVLDGKAQPIDSPLVQPPELVPKLTLPLDSSSMISEFANTPRSHAANLYGLAAL